MAGMVAFGGRTTTRSLYFSQYKGSLGLIPGSAPGKNPVQSLGPSGSISGGTAKENEFAIRNTGRSETFSMVAVIPKNEPAKACSRDGFRVIFRAVPLSGGAGVLAAGALMPFGCSFGVGLFASPYNRSDDSRVTMRQEKDHSEGRAYMGKASFSSELLHSEIVDREFLGKRVHGCCEVNSCKPSSELG